MFEDDDLGWNFNVGDLVHSWQCCLINELRTQGYDSCLRAVWSMSTFIVSRSAKYGLRDDQPFIAMNFRRVGIEVSTNLGSAPRFFIEGFLLESKMRCVLDQLKQCPIN